MSKKSVATEKTRLILEILKEERKRKNLTQTFISNRTGISKNTILSMEKSDYNPSLDFTLAYMNAVRMDFATLQRILNKKMEDLAISNSVENQ